MSDPEKPSTGPGIITFTLILLVVIICTGAVTGMWLFNRKARDEAAQWELNFRKVKYDYIVMKKFYKEQLAERAEIINSYKKNLELKEKQVNLLELAMQNIASDLEVAKVHEATVKQDLVTVLNQHTKALTILSEKDGIIDGLEKENKKLKAELNRSRPRKLKPVPVKVAKKPARPEPKPVRVTDENDDPIDMREISNLLKGKNDIDALKDKSRGKDADAVLEEIRKSTVGKKPAIDAIVTGYESGKELLSLNVGEEHGVRLGHTFAVYNAGELVGVVVVDKLRPKICRGCVLARKGPIREGMSATTRQY